MTFHVLGVIFMHLVFVLVGHQLGISGGQSNCGILILQVMEEWGLYYFLLLHYVVELFCMS